MKVPSKYTDFADIFSWKLTVELPEHTRINDHIIKFINDKQLPYGSIYSLVPMELETLKAYIKNNLANSFIKLSESSSRVPILFDKKPDSSLRLCIDYWGFNNLIIKNWYYLPLIRESLDQLGQAQCFTQLDLTNAYHRMKIRESNKWKIAFKTHYSHFKYQVILFRLIKHTS